ncbi:hypothetical protein CWR43_11670 [Rhizobium sullae]|uniref:Uncharacterized protein n=1 Tax=Rhizobium sullae TaxID=50338 RepID=A0A2N0DBW8_RHISU|nr:hypothetical protein CWR43_11670 [Rhizobium sullae]
MLPQGLQKTCHSTTISTSGLAKMNAAESQKSAAKQVVPCCFTIMIGSATIARVTPGEEPV